MDCVRLSEEKTDIDMQLAVASQAFNTSQALTTEPHRTYPHSEDDVRRTINDALFDALYLDEHGDITDTLMRHAFKLIIDAYQP